MSAFAALPQSATYVSQGFFYLNCILFQASLWTCSNKSLLSRVILLFLHPWRQDQVNVGGDDENGTSLERGILEGKGSSSGVGLHLECIVKVNTFRGQMRLRHVTCQ